MHLRVRTKLRHERSQRAGSLCYTRAPDGSFKPESTPSGDVERQSGLESQRIDQRRELSECIGARQERGRVTKRRHALT